MGRAKKNNTTKRKLSSGLERWNKARSYIASENRRLGSRYNGIEVNSITRSFLSEYYGTTFKEKDLKSFLKDEIQYFYQTPLDLTLKDLEETVYFNMDDLFSFKLPRDINIKISAGSFGNLSFNTSDYNYTNSGLQEIVNTLRTYTESLSPADQYPVFVGFIRRKEGASRDSKNSEDYYVEWVLYIQGKYVSSIKGSVIPRPSTKEERKFRPKIKKRAEIKEEQVLVKKSELEEMKKQLEEMRKEIEKLKKKK